MSKKYFERLKIKYIFAFIFYAVGVMGVLWAFTDTYKGTVRSTALPVMLIICLVVFILAQNKKAYFIHIAILALLSAAFVYCKWESIMPYMANVVRGVTDLKSLALYDITYLIIAIGILIAELMALMCIVTGCTWLYFIMITVLMLVTPIVGLGISLTSAVLIFVSFISLHILKKNKSIGVCVFSLVLTGVFLAVSQNIVEKSEEDLYDIADDAESLIIDNANSFIFNRLSDFDSGIINRGNNHQSGRDVMELWLSEQPNEDLYLRGFTGGEYTGGKWEYANESQFFTKISSERGWSRWGSIVDVTYKEIYYNANSASNPSSHVKGRRITINPLTGNIKNRYYPYVERWERLTRKNNIAYVYSYFELSELNIIRDNLMGQTLRIYDDMQKNYEPYVYETYLDYPQKGQERLKALCDSSDAEGLEEITKYIQNTLAQRAEYTLKPGMAPIDEDIVDYFLFENKRGYCVHFASAAALMFRMMGIPARYVTGYKVNKGLFYPQEDGTYYAVISDKYAHAWPEIYIRDKGWIPVEVTPNLNNIIEYEENNKEQTTESTTAFPENVTENTAEEITYNTAASNKNKSLPVIVLLISAVAFVFARRVFKLNRIKNHSVRRFFADIVDMLSLKGNKFTGLERDIVQRLYSAVPDIPKEDWQRLMDIVYSEAYGNIQCSKYEKSFVSDIYGKTSEFVYSNVNIFKKIYMRLIKVWL